MWLPSFPEASLKRAFRALTPVCRGSAKRLQKMSQRNTGMAGLLFASVLAGASYARNGADIVGPPNVCLDALKKAGARFEMAILPPAELSGCGADTPIRLFELTSIDGTKVILPSRPLLACTYATRFTDFVKMVVAPLALGFMRAPLVAIESGPGYSCRGRNQDSTAKVSAHGRGNALDVVAFLLADGNRILVKNQEGATSEAFVKALRTASCGWFSTVLGPGSDAAHADHLHLDTEPHGNGGFYRICQ
jgi:hypothetical protein